ncbi:MAG TPA: hypothetical protein PKO06_09305, partial [Candidatus Ozemobacteraceae bacterium]|nr:hypothetical protein [Candidatus Ozemobacteraceae bacterium]
MSRKQCLAFSLLICAWLSLGVAGAQANPFFFKGTDSGCQFRAAPDGSWQAVDAPKLICGAQMALRTEKGSWGTIVYSFGSMTLHPESEVLFQPNGLILKQGKYRAFIHASPRGFQF